MAWDPSQPWPGTEGGASSPHWGGYVRLYVRAGIASGNTFHLGPHAFDALDSGNVLGGSAVARVEVRAGPPRLWVDLSCDVLDVEVQGGASASAGIFTKIDAATCEVVLADPEGIYDPASVQPPFVYAGRTRLVPGIPVEVFAEVVDAVSGVVTSHHLFTGTADSWREDWTPHPSSRRCVLVASDATKTWVRYDRPEQPPVGNNDNTQQRVQRLVDYFGWPGAVEPAPSSSAILASTTLAASGWELLGRVMDDELGVAYFTPYGALRWTNRDAWFTEPPPVLTLGCGDVLPLPILDTFDRPDATKMGGGWIEEHGEWAVSGNAAALTAHSTPTPLRELCWWPTSSGDGVVSFALGSGGATNQQGVAFRILDHDSFLLVNFVTGTGNMNLTRYVDGVGASIVPAFPVPMGAGQRFTITLDGPTITVARADTGAVLQVATETAFQTQGGFGLTTGTAMATTARWAEIGWTYTHAVPAHDVLTDATPSSNDLNIRNVVRAARPGGTLQTATEQASVDAYGPYEYQRTDLGLVTDPWVTTWAADVVRASAWPRIVLEDVTLLPAIAPQSWDLWPLVLDLLYVTDPVRVVWQPPDLPDAPPKDQTARVVGTTHTISRAAWTVRWALAALSMSPTGTIVQDEDAAHVEQHDDELVDA